ncbi:amino acid ABC transporter substrate-binding protein [Marinobacter salinexigens]|uniref:Amino acid ABC transporter substrate-binding protein n=1 Tax=Marinobacter salinexigens TaxID=2919747 RepID=A0A5B0VML5_9GAMM|nr:transporter substrate-binding domain-containing protein [Marinobacter salinexigens]KAA1175624.1 amino acid ABC transporter substrate-binding protein [Marinobacter salinexigens]
MPKLLVILSLLFLMACSPSDDNQTTGSKAPPAPANGEEHSASNGDIATSSPMPGTSRSIVLAADPWCPHNCEAGSSQEGYMIEVARAAFAMAGIEVIYQNVSWARALKQVHEGHIDGVVGALAGEGGDLIFPEEPIGYSRTVLFTHPDSTWVWNGLASLANQSLLAINGYSYSPELDDYIRENQDKPEQVWIISGPSPLLRAIELLEQRRFDVFPEDLAVMEWTLHNKTTGIHPRNAGQIYQSPAYIAFSPAKANAPELADTLSDGIRALRSSGQLAKILDRYGVHKAD